MMGCKKIKCITCLCSHDSVQQNASFWQASIKHSMQPASWNRVPNLFQLLLPHSCTQAACAACDPSMPKDSQWVTHLVSLLATSGNGHLAHWQGCMPCFEQFTGDCILQKTVLQCSGVGSLHTCMTSHPDPLYLSQFIPSSQGHDRCGRPEHDSMGYLGHYAGIFGHLSTYVYRDRVYLDPNAEV